MLEQTAQVIRKYKNFLYNIGINLVKNYELQELIENEENQDELESRFQAFIQYYLFSIKNFPKLNLNVNLLLKQVIKNGWRPIYWQSKCLEQAIFKNDEQLFVEQLKYNFDLKAYQVKIKSFDVSELWYQSELVIDFQVKFEKSIIHWSTEVSKIKHLNQQEIIEECILQLFYLPMFVEEAKSYAAKNCSLK